MPKTFKKSRLIYSILKTDFMKRIQIMKASIIALAIGGAFVSKASNKQVLTRYTLASSPKGQPCNVPEASGCGGSSAICTIGAKTYYHLTSGQCITALRKFP
jgi:hypothetical protein